MCETFNCFDFKVLQKSSPRMSLQHVGFSTVLLLRYHSKTQQETHFHIGVFDCFIFEVLYQASVWEALQLVRFSTA